MFGLFETRSLTLLSMSSSISLFQSLPSGWMVIFCFVCGGPGGFVGLGGGLLSSCWLDGDVCCLCFLVEVSCGGVFFLLGGCSGRCPVIVPDSVCFQVLYPSGSSCSYFWLYFCLMLCLVFCLDELLFVQSCDWLCSTVQ